MRPTLNVLMVEDDIDDIELIVRELGHGDFELNYSQVYSLMELPDVLNREKWDVILCDYRLPGFSAMDVLATLRQIRDKTPLIVVSGMIGEEMAVAAMRAGAADVVMKNHLSRLGPTIQHVLHDALNLQEHAQMERVQSALIQLSRVALEARSLDDLYRTIHNIISGLMPAQNFYISLYDEQTDVLSFPYYIDEYDTTPPTEKLGRGLTAYVLRKGVPLLASPVIFEQLVASGDVMEEGAPSIDWLGVPLKYNGKSVGVLAVQSYTEGVRFTETDQKILEFVSTQVAMVIYRKRAEENLEAESRFRKAIENSILAGVIATDLDGRQSYVNPAFCRMIGWEEKDLLGASPPFVYWPVEEVENIREALAVVTGEDGLPGDFELRFQRRNGERFDVYMLLSPLTGDNGQLTGWLASVYDITARKSNEEAVRSQKGRAESLARTAARLNARLDLQAVLDTVCEETTRAFNVQAAAFFLFDSDHDRYVMASSSGLPGEVIRRANPVPGEFLRSQNGKIDGTFWIKELRERPGLFNLDLIKSLDIRAMLFSGLTQMEKPIGFLTALTIGESREFVEDELSLMDGLGDLAIQAITNARLFSEIENRLDQLHALHAVDLAISASMDLRITLNILLDHVIRLLKVDAADVLLFNAGTKELEYSVGRGFRTNLPGKIRQRLRNGFAGKAVLERSHVKISNLAETHNDPEMLLLAEREGLVSYYGVPLIAKGQVKGILEIMCRNSLHISADWEELLDALAGQAAIAIDNATLFDQLQRTNEELITAYDSTLEGWVRAMDLRDQASAGHTQRVIDLTLLLALKMGLREEDLVSLRRGALLHDIGNIGIADHILQKPGKLDEEEWQLIRQHPVFAYQMISPIAYLRASIDIPYCHHEKWDGTGYPRGLQGEQIPLAARIFSIVDVWDALISDRPYRQAWSTQEALEYIESQAGTSFDPAVVSVFMTFV
jgi:PAS domain S-box-containing protein